MWYRQAMYTSHTSHWDELEAAVTAQVLRDDDTSMQGLALDAPLRGSIVGKPCGEDFEGHSIVQFCVVATVTQPELRQSAASNTFAFSFAVNHPLPVVLPNTSDEASEVIDRYQADVHTHTMDAWSAAKACGSMPTLSEVKT